MGLSSRVGLVPRNARPTRSMLNRSHRRKCFSIILFGEGGGRSHRRGTRGRIWTMPCGANIVHIRTDDKEELWGTYAGGRSTIGKQTKQSWDVDLALTSEEPFWIVSTLASVKSHFKKASRFVVNMEIPQGSTSFSAVDRNDETQARI